MSAEEVQKPKLCLVNGTVFATSLELARNFNKHHKNVLQSITQLSLDLPGDFTELNFQPSEYNDRTGRPLPMYNLTRDGFTLLAMGFTGKEALQWKLLYIQAFNEMEAELRRRLARAGVFQWLKGLPALDQAFFGQRATLTVRDAVTLLHYTIKNLPPMDRNYIMAEIKRGHIAATKTANGRWLIYRDSFEAWLERRKQAA